MKNRNKHSIRAIALWLTLVAFAALTSGAGLGIVVGVAICMGGTTLLLALTRPADDWSKLRNSVVRLSHLSSLWSLAGIVMLSFAQWIDYQHGSRLAMAGRGVPVFVVLLVLGVVFSTGAMLSELRVRA